MLTNHFHSILAVCAGLALLAACQNKEHNIEEPGVPSFELSSTAETVSSQAGVVTFQVVADEAVNWSIVTSDTNLASISIEGTAEGTLTSSGTKTVSVSYTANRTLEAKTYVFTVGTDTENVQTKSYTFTLTQQAYESKYAFYLKDAGPVEVGAEAGTYTWTVVADSEVEYKAEVSMDGEVLGEGVAVEEGNITLTYAENTLTEKKVYTLTVTTSNTNVDAPTLTATLTQDSAAIEETLVNETFKTNLGSFTINNILMNSPLTYIWQWNSALSGCAKANAYVNRKNNAAQARLESPEFNLTGKKQYATLTFVHASKFFKDAPSELKVQYSIDGGENWTDAAIDIYPEGKDWSTVSATVDLSAACGNANVKFGFLYTSSTEASAAWEIQNVVLKAK